MWSYLLLSPLHIGNTGAAKSSTTACLQVQTFFFKFKEQDISSRQNGE